MKNIDNIYHLSYHPNTTYNLGIGATYKSITVNLGFGLINPGQERGKTRYLDAQFHKYGRKLVFDLFGQFYRGYFLTPKGFGNYNGQYYVRPDIEVNELGGSMQYVFNHKHFSYGASFLQDEWQKRSAGSFLLGLEIYTGNAVADSSLFPTAIDKNVAARNYKRVNFIQLGPSVGYAYTFVFKKHFFLTGAASVGFDVGHMMIKKNTQSLDVSGLTNTTLFRIATGYNSRVWSISLYYITNNVQLAHHPSGEQVQLNTNNLRLNFIRRFSPGKKVKKYLKVIEH